MCIWNNGSRNERYSVLLCPFNHTDALFNFHKFVKMEKPVLFGSELSPAVRGVLLTAKAMDLELEIRFVFEIEFFELVVC